MAFLNPWQQGDPSQFKQSDLWNTPWAQQALNNKSMSNYANTYGQQANNYLSGKSPLGTLANTYGQQSAQYMNGNNRIANASNQIGGYVSGLWRSLMEDPNGWGANGSASRSGYGGPNDPRIAGHMANLRGGQYNLLNDYAKQAANAGVAASRGGMGVQGGMARDAAGRLDAMRAAAGGYSNDYMNSAKLTLESDSLANARNSALASALASMAGTQMQGELGAGRLGVVIAGLQSNTALGAGRLGVDMAGLQLQGLKGQNEWDLPLLMQRAQDYRTDANNQMNWAQGEWKRQQEYKAAMQAQNDAQLQRDQAAELERALRRTSYGAVAPDLPSTMGDWNYYLGKNNYLFNSKQGNTPQTQSPAAINPRGSYY